MNQFIALNLAELVGQHPLGGKRDETSQFTESPRAFTEVIKNGDFILSTDGNFSYAVCRLKAGANRSPVKIPAISQSPVNPG
jgi:hypothetical protein